MKEQLLTVGETDLPSEIQRTLEYGPSPEALVDYVTALVEQTGSDYLKFARESELEQDFPLIEARHLSTLFKEGVETAMKLAIELLDGKEFGWWDIDQYRKKMAPIFEITSKGQFATVLGPYALNRVAGKGPLMIVNHSDLFPENSGIFLDALTNASVTNFGQGFSPQLIAANTFNRLTGGTQCPPYHPGPLMEPAASALLSIMPIDTQGAKVAWFNSGGDAISVGIAAAEIYTQMNRGEKERKVVYFKEAYHGNIEGRAGRVTGGINNTFHPKDRNSIELEFPDTLDKIEPVLEEIKRLTENDRISCVVFESTQGDGGGISIHPNFFVELVKLSLNYEIPLICDEVQSGFGRSGKIFDVEYLLHYWRNLPEVKSGSYPEKPPMIIAVAKSMTNGAAPGSAVILPKEYAILERAQGLNTYSAHPTTLAATIATVDLMRPETLAMVRRKRDIFEKTIQPYVGDDRLIKGLRGHGLHLFLEIAPGNNQLLQIELLGTKRILTGTVAREGLRVHAPINAPDIVWQSLAQTIGEVACQIENGNVSPQALKILNSGPSGLAVR